MLVALLAAATATIAPLEWAVQDVPLGAAPRVVYGGGTFVAIGNDDVATSPDGIKWTIHPGAAPLVHASVVTGPGVFVAVGVYFNTTTLVSASRMYTSPGGVEWTEETTLPEIANAASMAYGNGMFVVGGIDAILKFTIGANWTSEAVEGGGQPWNIAYGNGVFVAISWSSGVQWSGDMSITTMSLDDGAWALPTQFEPRIQNRIKHAFGGGVFIAIADNEANCVLTSTNGITWSTGAEAPLCGSENWRSLVYGNGLFVAIGTNGMMTSPDGSTWTTQGVQLDMDAAIGSGTVVAVGGGKIATATIACANNEAFYVQPQQEYSDADTNAYCVPTAAGNMLAATLGSSFNSYPSNNMYDYYDGTGWQDHVVDFWESIVPLPASLGSVSCDLNFDINCALFELMGTNVSGTTIANARAGLETYLRFLNQPYKVTHDENTALPQTPFMLHLRAECVGAPGAEAAMFTQQLDTNITLVTYTGDNSPSSFYGSSLGHTVVVYEATDNGAGSWTFRVASGLATSRTANDRTCADSITMNVINIEECVEGWTGIQYVPPAAPAYETTAAPAPNSDNDHTLRNVLIALLIALLCLGIWLVKRHTDDYASDMTDTIL